MIGLKGWRKRQESKYRIGRERAESDVSLLIQANLEGPIPGADRKGQ